MNIACRTYLTARLEALTLPGGVHPYVAGDEDHPGNIFFEEIPLDFLKDNDYAACCLQLRDASTRHGKLIAKARNAGKTAYTFTRRRYRREVTYRCLLYVAQAVELWGSGTAGLVEQLQQSIAANKIIAGSDNSAIRIDPQDAARPWDSDVEQQRQLRRPRLAIVRVQFSGGIQVIEEMPIIPSVEIVPHIHHL